MKPKFELRKYENSRHFLGDHWLHWEMVEGDPFFSKEFNKPITPGSIISLPARSFWGYR